MTDSPIKPGPSPLIRVFHFFTSLKLAVVLLFVSAVIVFLGTIAQVQEGLYLAQDRWFKSWWIIPEEGDPWWVLPYPAGYTLGILLLINLTGAHLRRFKYPPGGLGIMLVHYAVVMIACFLITKFLIWTPLYFSIVFGAFFIVEMLMTRNTQTALGQSGRKIGVDLMHFGIVVLLAGQLATDMFAVETHMAFKEGQTMRYSESRFDTELVVIKDNEHDPKSEDVVSIPQALMADENGNLAGEELKHAKLPFTIKIKSWQANSELINMTKAQEAEGTLRQALATLEARYATPENLTSEAKRAMETPGRLPVWKKALADMGVKPATDIVPQVEAIVADAAKAQQLADKVKAGFRTEMIDRFVMQGADMGVAAELVKRGQSVDATTLPPQASTPVAQSYRTVARKVMRDMESRNIPSAVVELIDTSGSLGTWIVSPHLKEQTVDYGGKKWRLALRIERTYYPFSVKLLKTTHEVYPGTDIPKDFRSRLLINHPAKGEQRETEVFMNAPLRYEGLTFFQYQMGKDELDRNRGTSSLQVVKNPGWFSPYFGCALVGYGMLRHFLLHLFRFIRKRA